MNNNFEVMGSSVFEQAVAEHSKYLNENPHKQIVCDPIITPFSRAMTSLGFVAKIKGGGCSTLRVCANDSCKSSHSTLYSKDGVEYWGCPHCKRISDS